MGWINDTYFYSKRTLKTIAENYTTLYDGLPLRSEVTNLWSLAEFKADFDIALSSIGRGKWSGEILQFKEYRHFGRLQQIVIADILGIDDYELEGLGFYSIPRLRGYAYYLMVTHLNRGGCNVKEA